MQEVREEGSASASRSRLVPVVALALAGLLTAFVVALYLGSASVRDGWREYNEAMRQEQVRFRTLRMAAGYGGFIHHFKNYVLRREDYYHTEAGRKLDEVQRAIDEIKELEWSDEGRQHLRTIERTFDEYRRKWILAAQPGSRQLSASELDQLVRVSDTDAMVGFGAISTEIDNRRAVGSRRFEEQIARLGGMALLGLIFVPGVIGLGWWLYRAYSTMARQSRALSESMAVAEQANLAKRRFVANVSHEIRTPLNAIVNLSQLGLRQAVDQRMRSYLEKIGTSSQAVLALVNDILDFSKMEAGRLSLELVRFDLELLAEAAAQATTVQLKGKPVEVVMQIDPDIPRYLTGDPARLAQVLTNLCTNAAKFTERGEIRVEVRLDATLGGDYLLRFSVADTGIGLNPDEARRLFRPFAQADDSITRRYGGTGLGLAICKELVELMGGQIGVDSAPGRGSTFWFTAKLAVAAQAAPALHAPSLAGIRVLLVEDSYSWRGILATYLGQMGTHVDVAVTGAEGRRAYARDADGQRHDVLIVDWSLQGETALDMLAELARSHAGFDPSRVIVLTSYDIESVRRAVAPLRVEAVLTKPVSPSSLLDALIQLLGRASPPVPAMPAPQAPPPGLAGRRVLLVEDNEVNQFVAQEILKQLGVQVEVADNGRHAIDLVRHSVFDLVLMDVQMPEMDGLTATRLIRSMLRDAPLPIIAMTAGATDEERAACLDAGMNAFVSKPIALDELVATLSRYLVAAPAV